MGRSIARDVPVRCTVKRCRGVLISIDVPKLAAATGVAHYQCDRCGMKFGTRFNVPLGVK